MHNRSGFILIMAFAFMAALTVFVGAMLYMATYGAKGIGAQRGDYELLNLADAGAQRALRELRDENIAGLSQGVAYLRGATASGTATNVANIRYIDGTSATIANTTAILWGFDCSPAASSRITFVTIGARASCASGGTGATLRVAYSIKGVAGLAALSKPLTTTMTYYYQQATDRTWTWDDIFNSVNNFTLTATRSAGNRNINLDSIFLYVGYVTNNLNENWNRPSYYATFPISLGSGTIESIAITDEQGKVHLNTASQALLQYLMQESGIASGTASTLATNIVTYRNTKPFDSVEELQLVSGMTSTYYGYINNLVTVYSYMNPYAQRPAGTRAPVNINTAPVTVLRAVFDTLGLGAGDPASLAADINTARTSSPFTCFYSVDAITTDFYDFVNGRSYLTATERNIVLDNCDPSLLIPVSGYAGYACTSTELCYSTGAFMVHPYALVAGRPFSVTTIFAPTGGHTFTTYSGDTTAAGYRRELYD